MNRILRVGCLLATAALVLSTAHAEPDAPAEAKPVYVIPITGMIEKGLIYVIRRGVLEAEREGAAAVIFTMDTPGGAVDATEDIIRIMDKLTVPSYTLVLRNAISAGAILALSTDHIYMTPGSKIGDAMPIAASPTGGAQALDEATREKITSYVDGIIRATAEQNGHNKELASCMVRREAEFKIGDKVICPEGQLLTMTNVEALQPDENGEPLLSAGTVDSLAALLDLIGMGHAPVIELEVTSSERIARFIAALAPLFLMGGLLGIYLEFKTPGVGLPGLLGLVCLAIYFWGHHVAGLAGMEDVVILMLGLVLLAVEFFVTPGFGVLGLAGLLLIVWGLLSAMIERLPGDPVYPSWDNLTDPLRTITIAFVLTGIGAVLAGKFLPRSSAFRVLVLDSTTGKEKGYSATKLGAELLGLTGEALTDLHPSGSAMFGDRKLDVVTRGEFVDEGSSVRVVETHGNRLVVESTDPGA